MSLRLCSYDSFHCGQPRRAWGYCADHEYLATDGRAADAYLGIEHHVQLDAEPIKPFLRQVNLSELARKSGIPHRSLQRLANGQRFVRLYTADRVAVALRQHPSSIWTEWSSL